MADQVQQSVPLSKIASKARWLLKIPEKMLTVRSRAGFAVTFHASLVKCFVSRGGGQVQLRREGIFRYTCLLSRPAFSSRNTEMHLINWLLATGGETSTGV